MTVQRRSYCFVTAGFFISHASDTWQPRPLSPKSGSRFQRSVNSPPARGLDGDIELDRFDRNRLRRYTDALRYRRPRSRRIFFSGPSPA